MKRGGRRSNCTWRAPRWCRPPRRARRAGTVSSPSRAPRASQSAPAAPKHKGAARAQSICSSCEHRLSYLTRSRVHVLAPKYVATRASEGGQSGVRCFQALYLELGPRVFHHAVDLEVGARAVSREGAQVAQLALDEVLARRQREGR
eukprot:6181016-Pleurochrysis_carterae.AAC.2